MPPKKKAQKADEDDPTLNILKFYRKKCELNGITQQSKLFKDYVEAIVNEGDQLKKVNLNNKPQKNANYIEKVKKVEALDLLSNDITPLGFFFS